jgi:copper amine oxidase-like protein
LTALPTAARGALLAMAMALVITAVPAIAATTASGPAAVAQAPSAPPPNFGSPPSGEVPILFNDHHVYSSPDRLKQNRVLAALVRGSTVLVPLRSMFEQTGATVAWDPATKTVDVSKPGSDVKVTVGKPEVVINGESRPLDVPPEIYKGAVVVPLRVIAEGMGAYVQWVAERRLVVVRYVPAAPPTAPPPATPAPTLPPAPAASAAPSPTPAPKPPPGYEKFVAGDYIVAPKVYNELSPGGSNGQGSYQVHGAIEIPLFNMPWMISGNFRQFQYNHPSNFTKASCAPTEPGCGTVVGGDPNFQLGACPSNDPGCVTVIGFQTYQATIGSGQAYVPSFTAQDRDFDAHLGLRVADPRIYLGVGYYWRSYNYLGYPNLRSLGFGIQKLPDLDQPFSLYGSAYFYPDVKGTYTGPSSALLGPLSGASFNLEYRVIKYDIGASYNVGTSPFFVDLGLLGDKGFGVTNAPSDFTHTGAYVGLGVHI